jgi:hypothetical protein
LQQKASKSREKILLDSRPLFVLCLQQRISYKFAANCLQDGFSADLRPVHDLQRVGGREHEQAGVRLLLEWLDQKGDKTHFHENLNIRIIPTCIHG